MHYTAEAKMGYVTTKDGVEIFYKDWGPRDAQVIFSSRLAAQR